jgi:serine/threonine-protein kinase
MTELLGGKYEVLELAGEGGMAKVYRGQTHGAAGFTRPVAIKRVLAPLSQNPEFLKMFVEEARVVSELDHPNIARLRSGPERRVLLGPRVGRWSDAQ